jgi:polar amino acid transport system substrate-binding protein
VAKPPIKLRVAYSDWYPYTYKEKNQASGFEIEIFKEVMKIMKIETEFNLYPWARCLYALKRGEADILTSLLKSPEREKFACFPDEQISVSRVMFFTTSEKNINFEDNYENLKPYKIGIISRFNYGNRFDNASYLQKDKAQNTEMLIKKLLGGRTDLIAENRIVIQAKAKKMNVLDKIKFIEPEIHHQNLYIGFSKTNKLGYICKEFSRQLKKFKTTKKYKAILKKYGIDQL